jgi:hypothetical protein
MTTTAEPWAAVDGWDVPGLLPGDRVHLARIEAAEKAEEARKQAEAQDRADARLERAVWEARQHAAMHGLPFDEARPFVNLPSVYDRADQMFARQDAEARADERAAAREAGLLHLLPELLDGPGVYDLSGPGSDGSRPGPAPAPTVKDLFPPVPQTKRTHPVRSRVRLALHKMTTPQERVKEYDRRKR